MLDLLDKPEEFRLSVQRTSASIASIVLYGHRAPEWDNFWASVSSSNRTNKLSN
jgi:hypothetical protein